MELQLTTCLVLFVFVCIAALEDVWLQDVNFDFDRRHLDAGLPSFLEFNLKREASEDVKLTLEENRRLNINAPVYETRRGADGIQALVEKATPPLKDVRFYHDKRNGGAFMARCSISQSGPCLRTVSGFLTIDNKIYTINPKLAVLEDAQVESRGVPHTIEKLNQQDDSDAKLPPHKGAQRGLDAVDATISKLSRREDLWRDLKQLLGLDDIGMDKKVNFRRKRNTDLMACEILVAVDTAIWDKYYGLSQATANENKETVTELRIREHFSHIINGLSLRYESIDDPDYDIYMTISGWIMYKTRNDTNPLPLGTEIEDTASNIVYADSDVYLDAVVPWAAGLPSNLPHNDHIMVFTGYELYSGFTNNTGVAGKAWVGDVCGTHRLSIVEDSNYFTTTSVAAHELGHNLGSWHDGSTNSPESSQCSPDDKFIMAPSVVLFTNQEDYTINPWTFSQCSVEAFKGVVTSLGSENCMLDHGDYYDVNEWTAHQQNLPGELYDADTQCRLLYGEASQSCTDTESEGICLIITCLKDSFCHYHTPARGTPCGNPADNKYCIDGQCVSKPTDTESTTTDSTTTTESTTTESTTAESTTTESTTAASTTTDSTTAESTTTESTTAESTTTESTTTESTTAESTTTESTTVESTTTESTTAKSTTAESTTTESTKVESTTPESTTTESTTTDSTTAESTTTESTTAESTTVESTTTESTTAESTTAETSTAQSTTTDSTTTDSTTAESTITESTTTVSTATGSTCVDVGWYDWSCYRISRYFRRRWRARPTWWCQDPNWGPPYGACCDYCASFV